MSESEYEKIRQAAVTQHLSVGEFVRRELRSSCEALSGTPVDEKLRAILDATQFSFPVGSIEEMNAEIEAGYSVGLP